MRKFKKTLKQMTNGYVNNREAVIIIGVTSDDTRTTLFRGTMWELRKVYRKNGWADKEVQSISSNWSGLTALVYTLDMNTGTETLNDEYDNVPEYCTKAEGGTYGNISTT